MYENEQIEIEMPLFVIVDTSRHEANTNWRENLVFFDSMYNNFFVRLRH